MSDSAQIHASLRERWWLLGAAVVIGGCGGFVYAHLAPTTYSAAAYVVAKPVTAANQQATPDPTVAVNFAQAFGRIITQDEVLGPAARSVSYPGGDFASHVQATTSPDAPLIKVVGTAGSADQASAYANAVATSLVTFGNLESAQTGVSLASFSQATPPQGPSSPNGTLDVAVGAASGLLVGALATMVRRETRTADGRLRSRIAAGDPPRQDDDEPRLADAPYPPIKAFTLDAHESPTSESDRFDSPRLSADRRGAAHDADRYDSARSEVDRYDLDRYSGERYGTQRGSDRRESSDHDDAAAQRYSSDWYSSERYTSSRFSTTNEDADEDGSAERERRERERALGDTLITARVVDSDAPKPSSHTSGSDPSESADITSARRSADAAKPSPAKPSPAKGGRQGKDDASAHSRHGADGTSGDPDTSESRPSGSRTAPSKAEPRSTQSGSATAKPGPGKGASARPGRPASTARTSASASTEAAESDPVGVRRGRP